MPEEKLSGEYLYAALILTDSFSLLPSSLAMALLHSSFTHGSFTEEETETDRSCKASISNVNNLSTLCPHSVLHLPGTLHASGKSRGAWIGYRVHRLSLHPVTQSRKATIACYFFPGKYWDAILRYLGINCSGDGALWLSPNVFAFKPVIPV